MCLFFLGSCIPFGIVCSPLISERRRRRRRRRKRERKKRKQKGKANAARLPTA